MRKLKGSKPVEYFEKEIDRILKFIKDTVNNASKCSVVIGLSGGIDSTTVLKLSAMALGPSKVRAVIMNEDNMGNPSPIPADTIAEYNNVRYDSIYIDKIIDSFNDELHPYRDEKLDKINRIAIGNIKARIRMIILYDFAIIDNSLVIGTTNKSEFDTGYFTKYGDGGVDFEPIAHLYKTEVMAIAKILDIPDVLITQVPTAGLWKDQKDSDDLKCSYRELDEYLDIGRYNKGDVANHIDHLKKISDHKRKMPDCLPRL